MFTLIQLYISRYTSKFRGSLKVYEVTQILPPRKGDNLFVRAKFVIDTLNNFLVSDHSDISTVHVPNFRQDDDGLRVPVEHDAKIVSTTSLSSNVETKL